MTTYNLVYGKFFVKVECERCGEHFTYTHFLERDVSNVQGGTLYLNSLPGLNNAIQMLENQRSDIVNKNKGLNAHRCPNCGYYQSWMDDGLKKLIVLYISIGVTAVSFIVAVIAAAISWGWEEILLLIAPPVVLGVFVFVFTYAISLFLVGKFYKRKLTIKKVNLPQLEWQKVLTLAGQPIK